MFPSTLRHYSYGDRSWVRSSAVGLHRTAANPSSPAALRHSRCTALRLLPWR